jgi:hypothetical protein
VERLFASQSGKGWCPASSVGGAQAKAKTERLSRHVVVIQRRGPDDEVAAHAEVPAVIHYFSLMPAVVA